MATPRRSTSLALVGDWNDAATMAAGTMEAAAEADGISSEAVGATTGRSSSTAASLRILCSSNSVRRRDSRSCSSSTRRASLAAPGAVAARAGYTCTEYGRWATRSPRSSCGSSDQGEAMGWVRDISSSCFGTASVILDSSSLCATWTTLVLAVGHEDEVFVEMPKRDIGGARR